MGGVWAQVPWSQGRALALAPSSTAIVSCSAQPSVTAMSSRPSSRRWRISWSISNGAHQLAVGPAIANLLGAQIDLALAGLRERRQCSSSSTTGSSPILVQLE